ncbi:MAG: hypothetical protein V2I25_16750 [Woeseiaceae bacterium]|jgi:hypothetical protein|nr:hypothetical protein [Woeseiaceae bacterium]
MRNRNDTDSTEVEGAGALYAAAYAAHYTAKDLHVAFGLYRSLMSSHPDTPEAGYSRSQIQHIAKAMVSKEKLFDAQVDLALACFEHGDRADEQ